MIGTVDDAIIISGFKKPIDSDNSVVFKIRRVYLHLLSLTYLLLISIYSFCNFSSISDNFYIGIIYIYLINNEILKKSLKRYYFIIFI